jgi:hypothetical protein
MTIDFIGLEPIDEQTAAAKLTIRGTTGNDVFSYTAAAVATKGLVRVENFETLEFVNKGRLTLEGLAGNDSFSMSNPSIPTGLTNTTVTGGDGYDSITVNEMGTTGVLTTTTANFTGKTPITFDTVEQIGFGVNTLADVGAIVNEAARSPFVWLFGTHQFRQRIGIRNLSSSLAVSGPLVVAFNLPGGVALTNRTGFTTVIAPAGRPFIRYTVADNVISPAERARRRAVFGHGPVALQKLQSQGYTINVFAGLGTA